MKNISRSQMLDEDLATKLNQTLGPTQQNDQFQQNELNDLSNIPQMTISINKKETQRSTSPKMSAQKNYGINQILSLPAEKEGSIYSQADRRKSEDEVKSLNEEFFHPQWLQNKSPGQTGHIHNLHELHKKTRPVSQNFQRKRNRVTQKRLQKILNSNLVKIGFINSRPMTPFTSGPTGTDKQHVLSGISPQNQYHNFLGGYDMFNLAEEVQRQQQQEDASLKSNEQSFSRLEKMLIQDLQHPKSAIANYSFQPSIMYQLNNDMKFKQVFRGIPHTRDVKARRTQTGFNLTHKGKFSFSQPQEIHFEIKKRLQKKHADAITLRTQPQVSSHEYNMQFPSRRLNLTVTSKMPRQQIESKNEVLIPRITRVSNISVPTNQAIITEFLNTNEDFKRGSSTNSRSNGSQKSSQRNSSPKKSRKKSKPQSTFQNIFDVHETVIGSHRKQLSDQTHQLAESTIRRTIELKQQRRSTLLMIKSQENESTSQNQSVSPGPAQVPTNLISKNNVTPPSLEENQDQQSSQLRTMRFSTESLQNGEYTNRTPFQAADFGWKGDKTISLNNKNLWLKQFGQVNSASKKTHQTSRSQAQISGNNSRKTNQMFEQTSQLKILLNNTLREINKKIPVKVIINTNYSNRAATAMFRRHHQRVLSQQESTQRRGQQMNKARPISGNRNLISNKKNSRLSSYDHPKNSQHSQDSVTEPLLLGTEPVQR